MKTRFFAGRFGLTVFIVAALWPALGGNIAACTGITLRSCGDTLVLARTIEWGGSNLNSRYVVVPRGHTSVSLTPDGGKNGMRFTSKYGYVGCAVEQDEFVVEGLNEAGLSAGLFYFPNYGEYEPYTENARKRSISDFQLVPFLLGECATIDEVKAAVARVKVVNIDSRASTVHWRFAEPGGRQVVLEIVGGKACFYENTLGVLTNSPGFEWQLTNLNNYVHLSPGAVVPTEFGNITLSAFGIGAGMMGLPGDITPPSRFVRAAFFQTVSPRPATAVQTVEQAFGIMNNFDIPIGVEFTHGEQPADIPSATQWTSVTVPAAGRIFYKTMYNSTIRCIDLRKIDFATTKYRVCRLDSSFRQPIEYIVIE